MYYINTTLDNILFKYNILFNKLYNENIFNKLSNLYNINKDKCIPFDDLDLLIKLINIQCDNIIIKLQFLQGKYYLTQEFLNEIKILIYNINKIIIKDKIHDDIISECFYSITELYDLLYCYNLLNNKSENNILSLNISLRTFKNNSEFFIKI